MSKSSLFFSANVRESTKGEIYSTLCINISARPRKYLGIPTEWGKSTKEALGYLKERIINCVQKWKSKLLS